LWAGRRYGVPTHAALLKIYQRYRTSQGSDGAWGYCPPPKEAQAIVVTPSASMTCAGLLGIACGHGADSDSKGRSKDGKASIDVNKDPSIVKGLQALSTAVDGPVGWNGEGNAPGAVSAAKGKGYYYLWSLERVCVLLGLETLGKKDWYNWGAEVLLKNQKLDGTWAGEYGGCGADTCFALLFLKKSDLLRDLSSGKVSDPGERKMKSGGSPRKDKGKKEEKPLKPLDIGN
jgi:hypothetical protein